MNSKPISPVLHGAIDYLFSAALLTVPRILRLKKKAKYLFAADAAGTIAYSVFTAYPLGVIQIIPYKLHRNVDIANIAMLALATLYKPVRKNKQAVLFNLTMISAALVTVLLTDWDKDDNQYMRY